MFQPSGGFTGQRSAYVPRAGVGASGGVYRSAYARPTGGSRAAYRGPTGGSRYRLRAPRPVVPAGRAPGGAGLLAAILGPIGGLTGCLCCLNTIGVWGLFITAIPLTVFISRWLRAYKSRYSSSSAADELIAPQLLLLVLLVCSYLFTFMRRS